MPILVETDRFSQADSPSKNVISYCGSMQGTKDGVPILIEAFSEIASQFPETNLQLIGPTDFEGFGHLQEQIDELDLTDRIVFTGRVERDEMPGLLRESRILALARPPSMNRLKVAFLPNWVNTCPPVVLSVVTSVGDIPEYLVHGKHALLAEPGRCGGFCKTAEIWPGQRKRAKNYWRCGKYAGRECFQLQGTG